MKSNTYLLLFIFITLFACSPAAEKPKPYRGKAVETNVRPENTSNRFVQWGKVSIPLKKYANPEVYEGSVEMTIMEFWELLDRPILLKHKEEILEFELADIYREPYRRSDSLRVNYPLLERGQLEPSIIQKFRNGVRQGDVIALRLFSTSDKTIVQSACVVISDPDKPYIPEVELYTPLHQPDIFGFQVIQESGKRPVLRIDTTARETNHVFELYRNNLLYKIIHIPDFKTERRLIGESQQLFSSKDIRKSTVTDKSILDWMQLPEYINAYRSSLEWGDMKASPTGPHYTLEQFRESFSHSLALRVNKEDMRIQGFRMIVNSEQHFPRAIVADDLHHPAVQKMLSQVQAASSVYFTQLIIKGADDQCMLLPQAFVFHIGR